MLAESRPTDKHYTESIHIPYHSNEAKITKQAQNTLNKLLRFQTIFLDSCTMKECFSHTHTQKHMVPNSNTICITWLFILCFPRFWLMFVDMKYKSQGRWTWYTDMILNINTNKVSPRIGRKEERVSGKNLRHRWIYQCTFSSSQNLDSWSWQEGGSYHEVMLQLC